MTITDLELMQQYAEDDSRHSLEGRQRILESWISAGFLTPEETQEAGRVLKILRERDRGLPRAA